MCWSDFVGLAFKDKLSRRLKMGKKSAVLHLRVILLVLGMVGCAAPVLLSPPPRANDSTNVPGPELAPDFPKQKVELQKWLKKEFVPGSTNLQEVTRVFGNDFTHPLIFGRPYGREDSYSKGEVQYDLRRMGVSGLDEYDVLMFRFDQKTGRLLEAAIEEEPRQTGFDRTIQTYGK
jgi:hypothetical protein